MKYPATRPKAELYGYRYYYTGEPCVKGHVSIRTTRYSKCKACVDEYQSGPHALSAALRIQRERTPCDDCPMYNKCARQGLSCRAFAEYIEERIWRTERRDPYRSIHAEIFDCPGVVIENE